MEAGIGPQSAICQGGRSHAVPGQLLPVEAKIEIAKAQATA
jgi:hypothetical protein